MTVTSSLVVSPLSSSIQLVDPKTGIPTAYGQVALSRIIQAINGALNILGQFNGVIGTSATVEGRIGSLASIVQHLTPAGQLAAAQLTGVVNAAQLPAALPAAQGAVQLPAGAGTNLLGSAALQPATAFDPAGSAATAQTNAETFATGAASAAQTNAENFARSASNITTGTLATGRLPGLTATIVTAQLTPTGTQGSMTFQNGLLIAQTPAT